MSAQANLNQQQFLGVAELGSMGSQYSDPGTGNTLSLDEAYHRPDLRFNPKADTRAQDNGWRDSQQQHVALRQSIRSQGIHNSIFYDPEARQVDNGHHRYFAGRDEGLTKFPVNDHTRKEPYQDVRGFDK